MRRLIRWKALALLAVVACAPGCSVADVLTGEEILEELDEIVSIAERSELGEVVYAEQARISSWYMRMFLLAPVRAPLGWTFGRRQLYALDNPGAHVRDLLRELPDETEGDLAICAAAASRFAWLAALDKNPETRVLALDGLTEMCRQLGLRPFAEEGEQLGTFTTAEQLATARAAIQAGRPGARAQDWDDASRAAYRDGLDALVARPLQGWVPRILLVEDLTALLAVESDLGARPWVEQALGTAIAHCARGVLLFTIQGRDRRFAEVRLCAMEQVRRLGGPASVPLMLAVMAASPEEQARNVSQFDPDWLVQLRLIHYCGQLDAATAAKTVTLPGQEAWQATSPVEFLARTVLNERGYYSRLRTAALVALTWCLRRPELDPDPTWVRTWIESRGT